MNKRSIRKPYFVLIYISLLSVFVFVLIAFANYLSMKKSYTFDSISGVFFGDSDKYLVIDNGRTCVETINQDNELTRQREGEENEGFYYADFVAQRGKGMYVSDSSYTYDSEDNITLEKRIILLYGSVQKVLFTKVYEMNSASENVAEDMLEIQYYKDRLYFIRSVETGIELYCIDEENNTELVERYYCGDTINDASYDPESGAVAITVKRGFIRVWDTTKRVWVTIDQNKTNYPDKVICRHGKIYFSENSENYVYEVPTDGSKIPEMLFQTKNRIISLEYSEDGGKILAGNTNGFYLYENGELSFTDSVTFKYYTITIILRILLVIVVLMSLLIVIVFFRFIKSIFVNEYAIRIVIVVTAVVVVTCFVAFPLLSNSYKKQDDNKITNMKLFAELLCTNTTPQNLTELAGYNLFGSAAYNAIKIPLDKLLEMAANDGVFYYYTIYDVYDGKVYSLIDSRETVMSGEPYDGKDLVYIKNSVILDYSYAVKSRDADGNWLSIYVPIDGLNGVPRYTLRLRSDLSLGNIQKRNTISDMVQNVLCTTAVVMMLILEGILLLSFTEKKRTYNDTEKRDVALNVPLRALIFFTNAADSMQDAFITLLCLKLYKGGLPIPDSVAVALPLSAQLLVLALFSGFAGRLGEKHGHCKVITFGLLIQCAGCVTCVLTGTYLGVFLGKCLIGAGMGMVYVNCYALAAKGATEKTSATAFTNITAGSLSGVTIGVGLSSVFFNLGGWKSVYIAAAVILVLSVMIAKAAIKNEKVSLIKQYDDTALVKEKKNTATEEEQKEKSVRFKQFFFNKRVFSFLVLIVFPFMMALAYREYFLPLIASMHGINEVTIARYYLICGLIFLYTGPAITNAFLERLGPLKSVFAACNLLALAVIMYVFIPIVPIAFLGVLILSFVTSFAYACMYTYFGQLPESVKYGESKAMGVYSVFESMGSALGPLLYGFLLSFGITNGIMKLGIILLVFSIGYMVLFGFSKTAIIPTEKPEESDQNN